MFILYLAWHWVIESNHTQWACQHSSHQLLQIIQVSVTHTCSVRVQVPDIIWSTYTTPTNTPAVRITFTFSHSMHMYDECLSHLFSVAKFASLDFLTSNVCPYLSLKKGSALLSISLFPHLRYKNHFYSFFLLGIFLLIAWLMVSS